MMEVKAESQFVALVLEQMRGVGPVRAKSMFGGHGIFLEDMMFGLVAHDTLFFKTDDTSRPEFEDANCGPFTYSSRGSTHVMPYYQAPDEVFDDEAAMRRWAELGIEAAQRARAKSKKKKPTKGQSSPE